jgi:hypothetical protein
MLISREYNYLHGDCWLFALELQRYMGWACVETWLKRPDVDHHMLCQLPDGRTIDATGWVKYSGCYGWDHNYEQAVEWARDYGACFRDTLDYLSFDVETLLFKLDIPFVTPEGHCVLRQLGLKS